MKTTEGYKYLVKIPGVRSGKTIVEGTRIGVHDVVVFIKFPRICSRLHGVGLDEPVIALLFEFKGEFLAARLDDASVP